MNKNAIFVLSGIFFILGALEARKLIKRDKNDEVAKKKIESIRYLENTHVFKTCMNQEFIKEIEMILDSIDNATTVDTLDSVMITIDDLETRFTIGELVKQ